MRRFNITVNGTAYDVAVEELGAEASAPVAPAPAATPAPVAKPAPAAPAGGTQVKCPMPGSIIDVKVSVGDTVSEGQILMILEAMKMENEIVAPVAGKVSSVVAKKGDSVNSDDLLLTIA